VRKSAYLIKALAGLKSLIMLDLSHTHVTDAGLMELARLMGLRNLDLRETQVTGRGVADLQKVLPTLQIKR
jgi:hypothetical protein